MPVTIHGVRDDASILLALVAAPTSAALDRSTLRRRVDVPPAASSLEARRFRRNTQELFRQQARPIARAPRTEAATSDVGERVRGFLGELVRAGIVVDDHRTHAAVLARLAGAWDHAAASHRLVAIAYRAGLGPEHAPLVRDHARALAEGRCSGCARCSADVERVTTRGT